MEIMLNDMIAIGLENIMGKRCFKHQKRNLSLLSRSGTHFLYAIFSRSLSSRQMLAIEAISSLLAIGKICLIMKHFTNFDFGRK